MSKLVVQHEGDRLIELSLMGECSIYDVLELKQDLSKLLDNKKNIAMDLSGVVGIDTSVVQLLTAFKLEAGRRQVTFSLLRHSPAVLRAFSLFGLGAFFGDILRVPEEITTLFKYGAADGLIASE